MKVVDLCIDIFMKKFIIFMGVEIESFFLHHDDIYSYSMRFARAVGENAQVEVGHVFTSICIDNKIKFFFG